MTAIDFPDSPTLDQVYTSGDRSWKWDGTVWNSLAKTLEGFPVGGSQYEVLVKNSGTDFDAVWSNNLTNTNHITLDTAPTSIPTTTGTISWDTDMETVSLKLDSNVTLQVGQEHLIRVKNNSGSVAIPNGTVVMFAGATGDTVKVTPAISTASYEPTLIVGITTEEIPADGFGFVTQFGFINNVDTDGMTLGDLLYVDPATPGLLTTTKPSPPNWTFPIAAVTKVNASSGRILVRTIPGDHLHDIIDVDIETPADNEVLAYDSTSGTWINQTASEAGLALVADPTFTGTVTAPLLRLTNTNDVSLSSTAHALQIGDSSTINLRIDNNEVMALNNGSPATLYLQTSGGILSIGQSSPATVNLSNSRINATHYPYAMSAGRTTMSGTGTTTVTRAITFPAGRFSQAPIITCNFDVGTTRYVNANSITSTGFTMVARDRNDAAISDTQPYSWQAIQMSSGSAGG
jgi:hypothetical protein